jgi:hypothetical protein
MKNYHKPVLVLLFAVLITTLPITSFAFMPRSEPIFSENENRYLTRLPSFTASNITSRRFMQGFDEWFADRFTLREDFIILQNNLESLQGKTEINGVFTANDRLILAWRREPEPHFARLLESVDSFAERHSVKSSVESFIMLVPSAQEIYSDLLPPNAQPGNEAAVISHVYANLPHLTGIDAATCLSENSGGYIFYRTDHHWTSEGAYWGYYAAAQRLGFAPFELGQFDAEHASSDFRGTLFSMTLNHRITPDVVSFYTLSRAPAPNTTLTVNNGRGITVHDSLYLREYLEQKDKYLAFTGPNVPLLEINTDLEDAPSLLVFKDSFANAMLPFLANHYSRITALDMRFINTDIRELADPNEYSQILFLYSATNFADDTSLAKLDLTEHT